jgi:hypothetical protein
MTDTLNNIKVLLPMIGKTMPSLAAQQFTGRHPLTGKRSGMFSRIISDDVERYMNKKYWPYQYKFEFDFHWARESQTIEIDRWCYKNFKSRNWRSMYGTYAFKRKEDFEWFLLRWA